MDSKDQQLELNGPRVRVEQEGMWVEVWWDDKGVHSTFPWPIGMEPLPPLDYVAMPSDLNVRKKSKVFAHISEHLRKFIKEMLR